MQLISIKPVPVLNTSGALASECEAAAAKSGSRNYARRGWNIEEEWRKNLAVRLIRVFKRGFKYNRRAEGDQTGRRREEKGLF